MLDDLITIVFCARCVVTTALYDASIERSAQAHAFSYETSPEIENSLSGKAMNGHGMSGFLPYYILLLRNCTNRGYSKCKWVLTIPLFSLQEQEYLGECNTESRVYVQKVKMLELRY